MHCQPAFKLLLWTSLTFASLIPHGLSLSPKRKGWGEKCTTNGQAPTVQQIQVGFGSSPKFMVVVNNKCPMCPIIDVHLKCGSFPQALVNPRLLKVLGVDDCLINSGLPLAPLQTFSFNYSHQKYLMYPKIWSFQCE